MIIRRILYIAMMSINILWTGKEYYSLETCLLDTTESGFTITSGIVGTYQEHMYRVNYVIKTNHAWETVSCEINAQLDFTNKSLRFQRNEQGDWTLNNEPADQFKGCIDIDIPLTPFTNTLPINRLKLAEKASQQIQVLYIDLLADEIRSVRQNYTRRSQTEYQYENVPNDFEAVITVDQLGLVIDYPGLFVRTAIQTNSTLR